MSSEILSKQAEKMWFKVEIISPNKNLFLIKSKKKKVYFKSIDCWINSSFWLKAADDKEITYKIAGENSIKIPRSIYITKEEFENYDFENISLNYPLVSKPVDWAHWTWVSMNLDNLNKLIIWAKFSFDYWNTQKIIVQEQITWDDHRILIIWWKFVAWIKRIPPEITWDWINNISKLIEIENSKEIRTKWWEHDSILSKIKIDPELVSCIEEQGYNLESILEKDITIRVRSNSNVSTWWVSVDITDEVWKDVKKECIKLCKILWLELAWVDVLTTDISKPLSETNGAIIEVNATPWFRMHHFPSKGKSRNVAKKLLEYVFS